MTEDEFTPLVEIVVGVPVQISGSATKWHDNAMQHNDKIFFIFPLGSINISQIKLGEGL
jgi:hypothetical protein